MTIKDNGIIGTPGIPWGPEEKKIWFNRQAIKRSYHQQVESKIEQIEHQMGDVLLVEQYGSLSIDPDKYNLWGLKSKHWQRSKPTVLISGGVHGYETSGVQGALRFIETALSSFANRYNFIVTPCISPWGYETINRWTAFAVDPNRSFTKGSVVQECQLFMNYLAAQKTDIRCHIDLHETTDTDNSEFRPALEMRDAVTQELWDIPDRFYTVGDSEKPQPAFQKAIINAVSKVTHIAPADQNGRLIGESVQQSGVINYPKKDLGLCAGCTSADYVSTTEVYPDSAKVDDENCILAQVAAITGALSYLDSQLEN